MVKKSAGTKSTTFRCRANILTTEPSGHIMYFKDASSKELSFVSLIILLTPVQKLTTKRHATVILLAINGKYNDSEAVTAIKDEKCRRKTKEKHFLNLLLETRSSMLRNK